MNLKSRKNRLFFGFFCLSLSLLAQATPIQAETPIPLPEPPEGPYSVSINVFLDPYYQPKMENVKTALRECSASLKEHLNLEITWFIHGRVFGIEQWHPANNTELNVVLTKKVGNLVKAEANLVFTNRNWIDKFCFAGFGHVSCDISPVHGYFYSDSSTMIIYHTNKCVRVTTRLNKIECVSNSNVLAHEIGHFLGLGHDLNPLSIMYAEYNPDGGQWLEYSIKKAKINMCFRGYLKCR